MKKLVTLLAIGMCLHATSQKDERISTIQFVQILDGHVDEALFYYKNNWNELRRKAKDQNLIASYEFFRTERSVDYPVDIVLITTYENEEQFEKREENFAGLMDGRRLQLMNQIEPGDFRKTLFVQERSLHSFEP